MTQTNGNGGPVVKPNYTIGGRQTVETPIDITARKRKGGISWGDIGSDEIGEVVTAICDSGAGLILGKTQDGGALSITILMGNQKVREYPNSTEDWDGFVEWVRMTFIVNLGKTATK